MIYFKSPDGEVFSYENQEARDIYGPSSLIRMTDAEVDAHLNPAPTYQQELAQLNAALQVKIDGYNKAFAIAALSDGASEEAKKLAIRADYEAARAQYVIDKDALKTKHGL